MKQKLVMPSIKLDPFWYTRKKRSKPQQGPALFTLLRILDMTQEEIQWSTMYRKGPLKFKAAFVMYMKYLVGQGFVTRRQEFIRERIKGMHNKYCTFFIITTKGRTFLEMFQ